MTIEKMRERKRELGYSYEQIAELANLPVGTVQKVLGGITKSPRYDTIQALEAVLDSKSNRMVRETTAVYQAKTQGEYTMEDYIALPDEQRVELIDGVFYDMSAPVVVHQAIGGEILNIIRNFIRDNKGKCIALAAPTDVQLNCDNKTIVQPDVLVVCDRDKFQNGRVFGAPDFVVEILSPATLKKDKVIKLAKYCNANVREYWIVDPDKKRVFVYDFTNDDFSWKDFPCVYTFDDVVPVQIFEGKCKVDFGEIYEYVKFLYES